MLLGVGERCLLKMGSAHCVNNVEVSQETWVQALTSPYISL